MLVKVAELTGLEPAFLTANNTVYSWTWLDLSNGPLLVEVPPKVLGAINDRGGYNLMNTTKALFSELVYNFRSERWNEFELPKLSLRELQALAKLLGCPSYGTKEMLVIRLLAQRELRFKLARFTDNPDELASSYRRESLRDMCREAGIWRSGNKRALSEGL